MQLVVTQALSVSLITGILIVWFQISRRLILGRQLIAYEPRASVPWNGLDMLLLFFLWPWFDGMAIKLSGSTFGEMRGEISARTMAAISVGRVAWVVAALIYLVLRSGRRPHDFGFDLGRLAGDVRLGLAAFFAALLPVFGTQALVSHWIEPPLHPLVKAIREDPTAVQFVLAIFSAVLVAPLAEEFLFRVVLQGWLEKQMPKLRRRAGPKVRLVSRILPILGSSALFAALHEGANRPALFVLAVFLGFLYRQTHRIAPCVVLHVAINSVTMIGLLLGTR
jgi:membrane protease YdiL (CAAX protease family)